MEEATFLTRFADKVHPAPPARQLPRVEDHAGAGASQRRRSSSHWNTVVEDVLGEDKVGGLAVRNLLSGEEPTLDVTGLFVAIGHDPRSELVRGQVDLDDEGYVAGRRPLDPRPTSTASSPAATSSTTPTGRRSPPPAPAAPAALDAERWLADRE